MEEALRLIIVADDPLIRATLAAQLAVWPAVVITGQAAVSPLENGELETAFGPADAVIWDAGWEPPAADPLDPLPAGPPVIALVNDADGAAAAVVLGSRGVLLRDLDIERILAAARAVAAGLFVMEPGLVAAVSAAASSSPPGPPEDLTAREVEVLTLMAEGLTNKGIGRRLGITDHTVKYHVNAILGKLAAQSRTEAVVRATRLGLISL